MQLNLTQADDWQIDWYLEEWNGSAWVAVDITDISASQNIKAGSYEQALTMNKISTSGGHFRATLASSLSAAAPIGFVTTQMQIIETGARTSTPPFQINVYEDITP